ncbi:MAG: metal-dependent hydrolase [Gemmatimonadales bacterium]
MHVGTHFFAGWLVGVAPELGRRERALITLAGVAPDLDGVGLVAETLTADSAHPLPWYSLYHHVLGHNLGFALLVAVTSALVATRRARTAMLALASFHLHLLLDLAGSRGTDGEQWPIPYLLPFSRALELTWSGQWTLGAWQKHGADRRPACRDGLGRLALRALAARPRQRACGRRGRPRAARAFRYSLIGWVA